MDIKINPIKGIRAVANQLSIDVNYKLNAPVQHLYFWFKDETQKIVEEGSLIIPEEVVEQWGSDDQVIIDWALYELGAIQSNNVIDEEIILSRKVS